MICDIDFTCIDGTRFRLKATLEKEKIDHEETLSQQKKEYMTEVKVCRSKAGMDRLGVYTFSPRKISRPRQFHINQVAGSNPLPSTAFFSACPVWIYTAQQ